MFHSMLMKKIQAGSCPTKKTGLVVIHFVYLCVYLHVFNFFRNEVFCGLLIEKLEKVSPFIFRYKDNGNLKVHLHAF